MQFERCTFARETETEDSFAIPSSLVDKRELIRAFHAPQTSRRTRKGTFDEYNEATTYVVRRSDLCKTNADWRYVYAMYIVLTFDVGRFEGAKVEALCRDVRVTVEAPSQHGGGRCCTPLHLAVRKYPRRG